MKIVYADKRILVCVKPAGVLSVDAPNGAPALLRAQLGDAQACLRPVHRLDAAASGLLLLARSRAAASILGQQMMERRFEKEYLAVVHGAPETPEGRMRDFLQRDRARRVSYVVPAPEKGAQEALLDYRVLARAGERTLVRIRLHTGRTHQIRCQFASRALPLVGERKYAAAADECPLALWSYRLAFDHPESGARMDFVLAPPREVPWDQFPIGGDGDDA